MIRKMKTGQYRLYSRKKDPKTGRRRNLGTFGSRAAAEKHERASTSSTHSAKVRRSHQALDESEQAVDQ